MVAITRQKEKKKEEKRARIEWHNLQQHRQRQQQQQSPIDDRSLSEDSALGAAAAALKDIIKTISLSLWLSVLTGKWQRTHCHRNNRGLRVT